MDLRAVCLVRAILDVFGSDERVVSGRDAEKAPPLGPEPALPDVVQNMRRFYEEL